MKAKTKKKSIKTKIIICFAALMIVMIICQLIFNAFFLKPCFTYSKKKVIENSFYQLEESYNGSISDIENLAEALQNKHSIKVILFDENEIIYTTGFSNQQEFVPPGNNEPEPKNFENGAEENKLQIPETAQFTEKPTIRTAGKNENGEQDLLLTGVFDYSGSSVYVLMSLPMESIETSVALYTRVSSVISIFVFIIGIAVAVMLSRSITKPVTSVEQVTKSLSELDFSRYADENVSSRELASLAKSINSMSIKLKSSIEELQIANDELKKDIDYKNKLEEMRRQFIANVSHEMKTPLGLLQLYCENLKNNVDGVDKEYYCGVIIDETEKLNRMVISMLDISSIESGLSKMNIRQMDFSAAARETAAKFITGYADYEFAADIDDDLMINGDTVHIEQAMNNYIQNAITHTKSGEKINISLKRINDIARFSVENRGKNISDEDIEHIWDAFYKSDKARTRTANNAGLGLYIVKTIIEKHMGTYGVSNTENGVIFYFEIPLIKMLVSPAEQDDI